VVIAAGVWAGLDDLVLIPGEDALYEVAVAVRSLRCEGELGKAAPVGPGFEHRPLHPGRDGPPVEDALLNIRHGCQVEPVRIPPTIAPGALCIWTIGQPAPEGSRALRRVTIKPVAADTTSGARIALRRDAAD